MESFYRHRPLIFAHRGASARAPANTLAAFTLASELGADGVELDTHLSKDGEVVVIHDFRLEATTDGQGPVRHKTLAELKSLDTGSWFDEAFAGQRIPTLQEVIDTVGQHLLLNIELKTKSLEDDGLAEGVVRVVEANGLVDRVIVSSFNPLALWRVKKLNPLVDVGLLYAPHLPFYLRHPWLRLLLRPNALHPHHTMVNEAYVRRAQRNGYLIHTWVVEDVDEMRKLIDWGVDSIITSQPDLLRQTILAGSE